MRRIGMTQPGAAQLPDGTDLVSCVTGPEGRQGRPLRQSLFRPFGAGTGNGGLLREYVVWDNNPRWLSQLHVLFRH